MTETTTLPSGAMLIGGEWVSDSSGGQYEHVYPGDGKVNAVITMAGDAEVDRAVDAAWDGQRAWMAMAVDARRDALLALSDAVLRYSDELRYLSVQDFGVPISLSASHTEQAARWLRYYAGWVDKGTGQTAPVSMSNDINIIEREPYGVVGTIIPWNGPLHGGTMALAPALAAGNAVVVKPSELAPLAMLRLGEICLEAGLPPGLVNILPGGPDAGDALVRHRGVRKIHFTGSGAIARKITVAAAQNLTPVCTELGGKSANIVFADADLDQAVWLTAFMGPLGQSGQSCACGSRVFVQDEIYDEFSRRLVSYIEAAKVGDPFDPETIVGPVVTEAAANRIMGAITTAVEQRAGTLLTGGERLGGTLQDGFYIAPTVLGDVVRSAPIAIEETFGPVISLIRFSTEEEVVGLANDSDFGLVAYLQTHDLERAHRVARQLEAGTVWVNTYSDIAPTGPYGGYKQSGTGRLGGIEGLHEFQQVKTIRLAMGPLGVDRSH
jgi:acyl-CoA reductase-like NAD-dependent aldehyde dehydrogenase